MYFGCNFIKLYILIVDSLCYNDGDFILHCIISEKGGESEVEIIFLSILCASH